MIKFNDQQLHFELDLDEISGDAEERVITYQEARQISEAAFSRLREVIKSEITRDELTDGWFSEYLRLVEHGWPWRVACYIAWASSPKSERWPAKLQDLATQILGLVGPRVIYTWRKKYPAIDSVVAVMQAAPLWEHRRDVIDALVKMAKTADYKNFNDRKLFLEITGDYVPKSKLDIGKSAKGDLDELSDDELRAWLGVVDTPDAERAIQVSSSKENGEGVGESPSPEEEGTAWIERGEDAV